MRRLLLATLGLTLLGVCLAVLSVRWTYFGQAEISGLRLSHKVGPALTHRLVLVLVDSVSIDLAFKENKLPGIARLRSRGCWGLLRTEEPTMTGQMVYTLATGARPYLYGVVRNWRQNRMGHETFLDVLDRAGLRVTLYGDAPWSQMFGDRLYHFFSVPEEGRRPDGRPYRWQNALNDLDHLVFAHLDAALANPRFDVLIWHIHGTDLVMHKYLRDSRLTALKLQWADVMVTEVVRQLEDGRTTFLILSDHGCAANGRHGYEDPEARRAFYLLFGPHIRAAGRLDLHQVDIAPTVAALYGWSPPAPSAGRPAVEALDLAALDRARLLVTAATQRLTYLQARNRVSPHAGLGPADKVRQAQDALARGELRQSAALSTAYLRAAWQEDLDARRERSWLVPSLTWLAVGLLLLALGWLLGRAVGTPGQRPGKAALAATAVVLGLLWALALVAAVLAGRAFNDHIDVWSPAAQVALWASVALALGAAGWLLRRPVARAWRRYPVDVLWVGAVALAVLPGYFQGIYMPALLLCLAAGLAWRRSLPGRGAWGLSAVVLAGSLVWACHWRPDCFFLRGAVVGPLGAGLAAAGLAAAAGAILWAGRRDAEGPVGRAGWLAVALLVAVVLARHLLVPLDSILHFPSVGDQVLAEVPLRLAFASLAGLVWALAWRMGLRGPRGAALGALAVLAAWGSPFEAFALSLLVAALAPFGQVRALAPAFATTSSGTADGAAGPTPAPGSLLPVLLGAVLLVAGRVVLQQPTEYYFNFTAVHDLFRFAPNIDTELGALALPVLLRYALPSLVLVPLVLGRLEPRQRLGAVIVAMLFAGARGLHLLLTLRLTIDQLYANWRGMGELILTAAWAVSLLMALGVYETGQLLAGRFLARAGRAGRFARGHHKE